MNADETEETVSAPGPDARAEVPTQPPTALTTEPPAEPPGTDIDPEAITRIATRARAVVRERIRAALDGATAASPALQPRSDLDEQLLDRIADEEAERADQALLHVAVVHAVSEELGIEPQAALEHPAVDHARELLEPDDRAGPAAESANGVDPLRPPTPAAERHGAVAVDDGGVRTRTPRQRALLLDAVHVFGIETIDPGDRDIELRLADVGIDVRRPSSNETIGRLRWDEIRTVAVKRARRGLPGRRRPALFVAGTDRGEVTFELPGVSDDEIVQHLEPLITRNCAGYFESDAG